jgi:TorA maturation chaperone TorD
MISPLQKALEYKFLSRCLAFPNQAFIPSLIETSNTIETNQKERQALIMAFELEESETLQAEYTRLFINGYPHTVCPPYESVYLEKRMHGDAAVSVSAAYAEWEMTVEAGLIDHLSTELEFLAFLASAESLETDISKEAQEASKRFVRDHLHRWVPQFIEDLKVGATLDAYRMLGKLMEAVLAEYWPAQ